MATYTRDGRHSYFEDLARFTRDAADVDTQERLAAHAEDIVAAHVEDDGAMARFVPPTYLLDQADGYAASARYTGVIFAQALPKATDSINIPLVMGGDPEKNPYISAPVRTIAGQQGIHAKLLDDSPLMFDMIMFRDLVVDYATNLNRQIIFGTGMEGQLLGSRDGVPTVNLAGQNSEAVYDAIHQAARRISETRFLPPDVVLMHPRRWAALLTMIIDGRGAADRLMWRPSVEPDAAVAAHLRFYADADADPTEIAVVTDMDMIDGDTDFIHVMRSDDPALWRSGLRARCLPESEDDLVLFQVYSYVAFTAQRYASIIEIGGLEAPQF